MDEQQRDNIIMNIEFITEEAEKERRRLLNKGVSLRVDRMQANANIVLQVKESALPPLSEDVRHRLLKHFAGEGFFNSALSHFVKCILHLTFAPIDIEFKKRKSEQNIHAHNSREKMFVDMEKQQVRY